MKVTTDSCLFGSWCAETIMKSHDAPAGSRSDQKILDIGTGTGLLSLMIAQKSPIPIEAVEIEPMAARQAAVNVAASPFHDQILIIEQDILQFNPPANYNYIVCNPPFYENELLSSSIHKNMAHHSSHLKLTDVLTLAKNWLEDSGALFLLVPYKRWQQIQAFIENSLLFINEAVLVKQSVAHPPFRVMLRVSKKAFQLSEETLSICKENNVYTEEFVDLLKDYYLYL